MQVEDLGGRFRCRLVVSEWNSEIVLWSWPVLCNGTCSRQIRARSTVCRKNLGYSMCPDRINWTDGCHWVPYLCIDSQCLSLDRTALHGLKLGAQNRTVSCVFCEKRNYLQKWTCCMLGFSYIHRDYAMIQLNGAGPCLGFDVCVGLRCCSCW